MPFFSDPVLPIYLEGELLPRSAHLSPVTSSIGAPKSPSPSPGDRTATRGWRFFLVPSGFLQKENREGENIPRHRLQKVP